MRKAAIYRNGQRVATLTEHVTEEGQSYLFAYTDDWYADPERPAVSLTLPKTQKEHRSETLFPFFFNMLSEGVNRQLQSRLLQIDERDHFGLLLATAEDDTIGAITVKPIDT